MEINNQLLEGQKKRDDNLDVTSTSGSLENEEEQKEPEQVELNSNPIPTEQEMEQGGVEQVQTEPVQEQPEGNDVLPNQNELEHVEPEQELVHEELGVTETPAMRTFTQSQVDDIAGKTRTETREKTFRYIYDRYGVSNEQELDDLIGNAQRYDSLQEQYNGEKASWKQERDARDQELANIKEQVALMQSGIDDKRYEDARYILKGKGLEVSLENIKAELASHPEWSKTTNNEFNVNPNYAKVGESQSAETKPVSKISVLGNDNPNTKPNEEDYVLGRMFKV